MKFLLFTIFILSSLTVVSQKTPPELASRLQGKTTITEIMREVDDFYQGAGKNLRYQANSREIVEDNYLFWKRWEWWMLSHLDENGKFVNIAKKNWEATNKVDQKWGGLIPKDAFAPVSRTGTEAQMQNNKTSGVESAYGAWTSIGPNNDGSQHQGDILGLGRIDRIAFHPTNSNIIFIGSPTGGLWKTTNGGTSWTPMTNSLPGLGVAGIAISPTNGNIIYVLTGDGDSHSAGYLVFDFGSSQETLGVFKSTDGGNTWTKTGNMYTGTNTFEGHRLAISPTNGNYLFAATSQGLWRTTNGGSTWESVRAGEYWDVKFKPSSDSTVYASTNTDVFYSTDGGRSGTWNTSSFDFSNGSVRIELATTPDNPTWVYALCGDVPSTGTFTGLFRSTNSGANFYRRTNTPNILGSEKNGGGTGDQSGYDLGVAVKPTDGSYVVTAALNVWRSNGSNGGSSMVYSTVYRENQGTASEYIHPDVHAIAYNPLNNYLYAGTDGGIYRSIDDGVNWTNLSDGVATTQFYRFSMRDSDANGEMEGISLIGGAQDNGIKFRTSTGSYKHVVCCDGFGSAIAPNNASVLYMNINDRFYKSTDAGSTYSSLINTVTFFSPIAINYSNSDMVFLGGGDTRRSIDGFSTTDFTHGQNTRRVLVTCPSNSNRLYGSSGSNVVRSDDQITTWTTKSGTTGWPAATLTVNDIKPSPTNSLIVYVCFGGYSDGNKVLRSTNGGDSWTNWTGGLPNVPCYSLAVASEGVYVGTEIGVFFRATGFTDWVPFYSFMPRIPVTGLAVNENNLIYASTFGRGMWFSNRYAGCVNDLTVSNTNLQGPYYFQANNTLTTTLTAQGSAGTEIFAHAGSYVDLMPGFEVEAGSFFKAYVSPCNTGGIPTARTAQPLIVLPDIKEVTLKVKPASSAEYWTTSNGELEFAITEKRKLGFFAKDDKNRWIEFHPGEIIYPGVYRLPLPNPTIKEVELRHSGGTVQKLGP